MEELVIMEQEFRANAEGVDLTIEKAGVVFVEKV